MLLVTISRPRRSSIGMRKGIVFIFLSLLSFIGFSQKHAAKVSITSQESANKIEIYATNQNPIPVSIQLTFDLKGLELQPDADTYKIIDSNRPPELVATLNKKPNTGWNYRYAMQVYLGNFYSPGHDSTYIYALPFKKGTAHYLSQGYNGTFSHHGINAIDFIMPTGTPIHAMRDGIVAEVVEHNNDGCASRSCLNMANSILVYHNDGSFSRYSHLKVNGAIVEIGDQVVQGDHIGYSGNTGWSSEPHLHFSIFEIGEGNTSYSVPTLFMTEQGAMYLEEKKKYTHP